MNITINSLFEQQKQALAERNQLKYNADKEDDLLNTSFEQVDSKIIRINTELKNAYNQLYRKCKN